MTIATVKRVTANYSLKIPIFDSPLWGRIIEQDLDIIDSALYAGTGLSGITGLWTNGITYTQSDKAIDVADNSIWQCMVTHTSAATGSFATDRISNPTYWIPVTSTANYLGVWQPTYNYNTNEFLNDGYRYGVVRMRYTSGTSYNADVAAGKIITLVDLTIPVNEVNEDAFNANASATSAASSKAAAANSAIAADASAVAAQAAYNAIMPDAASDGKSYGRKNAAWTAVTAEAPVDGKAYSRKDGAWNAFPANIIVSDAVPSGTFLNGQMWYESDTGNTYMYYIDADSSQWVQLSGFTVSSTSGGAGGLSDAPIDGQNYMRRSGAWVVVSSTGGVAEAPIDGKQYVRKDGAWVVVDTPFSIEAVTGDVILKFAANIVIRIKSTGLILTKDDIEVFSTSV